MPRPPHPRVRRTQAERRLETQQSLINSTIEVLRNKRYVGLRMADVAKQAGVSRGAQTHHFVSKDALVLQALEEVFRRAHARAIERVGQAAAEPALILGLLMEDSREFFLGADFLLSLDLLMVEPLSTLGLEVKRLAQQYRLPVEQAWVAALTQAAHSRQNAEDVVRLTYAVARGLGVRQLIQDDGHAVADVMAGWHRTAQSLLGGPQGRARRRA